MKDQRGFTLIEIMVVVIILGLLAGLVLPRVLGQEEKARINAAKTQIRALEGALDAFKLDNGFYPATDQALDALDKDREFLTKGGVFTNDLIDAYIALKMQDVTRFRMTTHPVEFDMYYSA